MSYAMYLITEGGVELPIPVLPDALKVDSPGKNKTTTVMGLGEVLLLQKKGLRSLAWDGYFPAQTALHSTTMVQNAPYVADGITLVPPMTLVQSIQDARDTLRPLRFLLLGSKMGINTQMGVDSFDYEERGGEPGALYYSIKLTEWRDYAPKRLVLSQEGQTATEEPADRGGTPAPPKSHTVVSGDSLWAIAKRSYGDGAKWKAIYDENRSIIGANPNKIYPGQELTIP